MLSFGWAVILPRDNPLHFVEGKRYLTASTNIFLLFNPKQHSLHTLCLKKKKKQYKNHTLWVVHSSECVVPENIHTSPKDGFYFEPPPLWKFQFRFIRSFKLLAFVTLHPLRNIGVGMDILWNHTIISFKRS